MDTKQRKAVFCYQRPSNWRETLQTAISEASQSKLYQETNGNSQLPPLQELLDKVTVTQEDLEEWEDWQRHKVSQPEASDHEPGLDDSAMSDWDEALTSAEPPTPCFYYRRERSCRR